MSDDLAISVQNVSKAYRIWETPAARLTSPLLHAVGHFTRSDGLKRRAARGFRDFWALKDISFEVKKGESVGIIGRNGSGKSTLLQIIAGTLQPTTGTVAVNGRVAALLELGSGFNPDFTGRENVFLNGAVLGLSHREMDHRFDEIAAFADIGDFIEQPVKTYSSGMMIRLAFAVAVAVEPEILIVDEALSVGDVFFQQKCFKRVHEMLAKGVSLLFVSHDTAAVQNLCDTAHTLKNGETIYHGSPDEAVSRYYASSAPMAAASAAGPKAAAEKSARNGQALAMLGQHNIRAQARSEHGAMDLQIEEVALFDAYDRVTRDFKVGETMHVLLRLRASQFIGAPSCGFHLYDRMNNLVFAAGTRQLKVELGDFAAGDTRIMEFMLELNIAPGVYTFSVGCSQLSSEGPNLGFTQHRVEGLGPINVLPAPAQDGTWPFYGATRLPLVIVDHG